MLRSRWNGFGDASLFANVDPNTVAGGGFDLSSLVSPPAGSLQDLLGAQSAANAGLVNVDPITALQSKLSATIPKGAGLPLAIAGIGLLALLLVPTPPSGGRRR